MTTQWHFVIAAYAVTAVGTFGVLLASWAAMRRAERAVDAMAIHPGDSTPAQSEP